MQIINQFWRFWDVGRSRPYWTEIELKKKDFVWINKQFSIMILVFFFIASIDYESPRWDWVFRSCEKIKFNVVQYWVPIHCVVFITSMLVEVFDELVSNLSIPPRGVIYSKSLTVSTDTLASSIVFQWPPARCIAVAFANFCNQRAGGHASFPALRPRFKSTPKRSNSKSYKILSNIYLVCIFFSITHVLFVMIEKVIYDTYLNRHC